MHSNAQSYFVNDCGFDVEIRPTLYFLLIDFWSDCGLLLMLEKQSLHENLAYIK